MNIDCNVHQLLARADVIISVLLIIFQCSTCLSLGDTVDYLLTGVWFGLFIMSTGLMVGIKEKKPAAIVLFDPIKNKSKSFRIAVMALLSIFFGLIIVCLYSWNISYAIYYCGSDGYYDYGGKCVWRQVSDSIFIFLGSLAVVVNGGLVAKSLINMSISSCPIETNRTEVATI